MGSRCFCIETYKLILLPPCSCPEFHSTLSSSYYHSSWTLVLAFRFVLSTPVLLSPFIYACPNSPSHTFLLCNALVLAAYGYQTLLFEWVTSTPFPLSVFDNRRPWTIVNMVIKGPIPSNDVVHLVISYQLPPSHISLPCHTIHFLIGHHVLAG